MKTDEKRAISITLLITLVVFALLTSPTYPESAVPELKPIPDKAVVIVYRDKKLKASAVDYKTYLNDVPIALLTNGTWAGAVVPPGSHDLWIEIYNPGGLISRSVTIFQWDAGRVYFIKEDSYFISDGLTWRASATLVDEQTGKHEIKPLNQAKNTESTSKHGSGALSHFVVINQLPSVSR